MIKIRKISIIIIFILVIAFLIMLPRISMHIKYKYVFDDINALMKQASLDANLNDDVIAGLEGFSPTKIYIRTKESLTLVESLVKDILLSNRHENIEASGPAREIYFGEYIIMHQGSASLKKISENGELITIKSVSPPGETISGKVNELQKKIQAKQ